MSNLRHATWRAGAAAVIVLAAAGASDPAAAWAESAQPVFAIAAVLSGAPDDSSVNESVTDALDALRDSELVAGHAYDYTTAFPGPADAAGQIMQFGSEPWGVVLVAGPYKDAVLAAAEANPQRAFVFLPAAAPAAGLELPANVSVITPDAAEGGLVLGAIADELDAGRIRVLSNDVEGVTPPAHLFNEGFVAAVSAPDTVDVVAPLGDLGAVDVLVMNRPLSADDTASIASSGVPLLANAADVSDLADSVIASNVYRWDLPLGEIISDIVHGDLGGDVHLLDLANGGLEVRIGDGFGDQPGVAAAAEAAIAAIVPPTTTPPTTTPPPVTTAPGSIATAPPPPDTQTTPTQPAPGSPGTTAPATPAPTTAPATPAPTEPPAPSAGACEGLGVGTANQWRADAGVAPLSAAGLGACSWAQQMAQSQTLSHAGGQPGEVVYSGYSCSAAWSGWAGSPSHYELIVSPDYSLGDFQCVTDSNGVVWAVGRLSW